MNKIIVTIIFVIYVGFSATAFTADYWHFPLKNDKATAYRDSKGSTDYWKCSPLLGTAFTFQIEHVNIKPFRGGIRIDIESDGRVDSELVFYSKAECEKNYKLYYPE
ncbi:MAG: hypothetical protein KA807_18300 [Prolixibacteraceae bacterium]|nr:hypothetical protein [Prolixibacteraceae bacterium]